MERDSLFDVNLDEIRDYIRKKIKRSRELSKLIGKNKLKQVTNLLTEEEEILLERDNAELVWINKKIEEKQNILLSLCAYRGSLNYYQDAINVEYT